MDSPRTYTISEAAALTGLHKNTVRQRIRLGQLTAEILPGKFGDEYRIPHGALVAAGLLGADPLIQPNGPAAGPALESEPPAAAEFAAEPAARVAATGPETAAALRDLYARHEQAMFRLGYLQGELDRAKALAETAESLRRDNEEQRSEADALRRALAEREAREAAARAEAETARARLAELDGLRESLAGLKALAAEQQAVIETLSAPRPRRRWPW